MTSMFYSEAMLGVPHTLSPATSVGGGLRVRRAKNQPWHTLGVALDRQFWGAVLNGKSLHSSGGMQGPCVPCGVMCELGGRGQHMP